MVRACPSVTCAVTVQRHYEILSKADVDVDRLSNTRQWGTYETAMVMPWTMLIKK